MIYGQIRVLGLAFSAEQRGAFHFDTCICFVRVFSLRIKLCTRASLLLFNGSFCAQGGPVRADLGHSLKSVSNGQNASSKRDFATLQTVWITVAIKPIMVMADRGKNSPRVAKTLVVTTTFFENEIPILLLLQAWRHA